MAQTKNQAHKLEILNLFMIALVTVLGFVFMDSLNATIVTVVVVVYFIANLTYTMLNHTLTTKKVLEFGLVALIVEFIALNYFI